MTIGRILEKLEADLRAMTAERDKWLAASITLSEGGVARVKGLMADLQAMTAERDAALADAKVWRDIAADIMSKQAVQIMRLEAMAQDARKAAADAADDFGYFW